MKALLLLLFSGFFISHQVFADSIKLCTGSDNHAPYIWLTEEQPEGAVVDLLEEIFQRLDMEYSIDLLPWKRCQTEVEEFGELQRYEVFFNGIYTRKRATKFLSTEATHHTRWGLFYSANQYPNGLDLSEPNSLAEKYVPCVERGAPLWHQFGINLWNVVYATRMANALEMMNLGRCDFSISSYETERGNKMLTAAGLPEGIAAANLEAVALPYRAHHALWISRSSSRGNDLQRKFNQTLKEIKTDGTYDKIFQPYWERMDMPYVAIAELSPSVESP